MFFKLRTDSVLECVGGRLLFPQILLIDFLKEVERVVIEAFWFELELLFSLSASQEEISWESFPWDDWVLQELLEFTVWFLGGFFEVDLLVDKFFPEFLALFTLLWTILLQSAPKLGERRNLSSRIRIFDKERVDDFYTVFGREIMTHFTRSKLQSYWKNFPKFHGFLIFWVREWKILQSPIKINEFQL